MIKLYSFGSAFNLADPSPFVTKIDLYLRANNIKFENIPSAENLQKAPKGKLPFIEDEGLLIADSSFIIKHLEQYHNADIDEWLNIKQKATAYLLSKSLEENLYWCIVHSRWVDDLTWPTVKSAFFDKMPFPLNKTVPVIARKNVIKNINGHGMGKHSTAEIMTIAQQSIESLSVLLGNKNYFFGEKISSFDTTAYAMISSLIQASIDNPMNDLARRYGNLVAYTKRIQQEYYPELS